MGSGLQRQMNHHPMGWEDDAPEALALISEPLFGSETPNADGAVPREIWELFQEGQSCTGHGLVQGDYGLTGKRNSPYAVWWDGRAEEYPYIAQDPNGHMPNVGLSMTQIMTAAQYSGGCQWDLWNPTMAEFSIHAKPPGLALVDTQSHNYDVAAVLGFGDALPTAAAVSLDSWSKQDGPREVPLIALDVDQALIDYKGGILREQSGPSLGGHMGALWQHWEVAGERVFTFITNWRGPKIITLSEARVRQARRIFRMRGVG
jgi:hypothetical protein